MEARAVDRDAGQARPHREEEAEAHGHAAERGDDRLDRRHHPDLTGCRAGEAQGGQPLLAAGGGEWVAVATNTTTGASRPTPPTANTMRIARVRFRLTGAASMLCTVSTPGCARSSSGAWPTNTTRSSGEARASRPTVAVTRPGKRSASRDRSVSSRSSASRGDAAISPGPGSASSPGGTGASGPAAARSTRTMSRPS